MFKEKLLVIRDKVITSWYALGSKRKIVGPIFGLLFLTASLGVGLYLFRTIQYNRSRAAGSTEITHIVIMDKENRTFDNYFGTFPGADGATTYTGADGQQHPLNRQPIKLLNDVDHTAEAASYAYNGGQLNLFSQLNGAIQGGIDVADSQFLEQDIPNYWQYARNFTLHDNFYSTILSQSFSNHLFSIAADNEDVLTNPLGPDGNWRVQWGCDAPQGTTVKEVNKDGKVTYKYPCFDSFPTLGELLNSHNISWKYYAPSSLDEDIGYVWSTYDAIKNIRTTPEWQDHVVNYTQFETDAKNGNLPAVSWLVETDALSDHPNQGSNVCQAENWTVRQINAIMQNPDLWAHTAIILTWDDFGGFYDHVKPPPGPNPKIQFGYRVPTIIISPYAKRGFIDHTMYSFPSMLKFAETILNLPNLGYLDGPQSPLGNLMNSFDFNQTPRAPLVLQERDCSAPTSPVNLTVAGNTIRWTPGIGGNPQYIRVGTDQAAVIAGCLRGTGPGTGCVDKSAALPTNQNIYAVPEAMTAGTTYYWRVANSDGKTMKDAIVSVKYDPYTPATNLVVNGKTITWTPGAGGLPQYIRVGTDLNAVNGGCQPTMTGCIDKSAALPATQSTYTLSESLNPDTLYYWRIAGSNGVSVVRNSVIAIKTLPYVAPTSPTELSVNGQTISWQPGAGRRPQYIRVGTDQSAVKAGCPNGVGGNTGCISKSGVLFSDLNIYTIPEALKPNTTYYWRVANSVGDATTMDAMVSAVAGGGTPGPTPVASPSPTPSTGGITINDYAIQQQTPSWFLAIGGINIQLAKKARLTDAGQVWGSDFDVTFVADPTGGDYVYLFLPSNNAPSGCNINSTCKISVAVIDASGNLSNSMEVTLPSAPPPGPQTSPTNLSVNGNTITWTPGSGGRPQYIRVGTDPNNLKTGCTNTGCVYESVQLPAFLNTFTIPATLIPLTTYYWRVANSDGISMKDAIIPVTAP